MNEEQIKELAEKAFPYTKGTSSFDRMRMIKGFIEGYKLAQPKWISVEERLPEQLHVVEVYVKKPIWSDTYEYFNQVAFLDHDNNFYLAGMREIKNVTHWKELSSPPKEYSCPKCNAGCYNVKVCYDCLTPPNLSNELR